MSNIEITAVSSMYLCENTTTVPRPYKDDFRVSKRGPYKDRSLVFQTRSS